MGEKFRTSVSEIPRDIPLDKIKENPLNPRRYFDEEGIQELAENIKEVGLLQPIRLRLVDGGHQIVHGHRRYRAVKMLGWETIPATVTTMSEQEAYEASLSENILRANLSAIEEAEGFKRLIDEFDYTQKDVAKKFGKSQQFVSSRLVLLKLPEPVQEKITTRVVKASHGELLAKINDTERQIELANEVEQDGLSVRELGRKVSELIKDEQSQAMPTETESIQEASASEDKAEPFESVEQADGNEQPQEVEVIEEAEPVTPTVETESQPQNTAKYRSESEKEAELSQLELEPATEDRPVIEQKSRPSTLTTLSCLNEPLRAEFQKNLARQKATDDFVLRLNEYTHQVSRQENVDNAIGICGEIKAVALSMKETLEQSKAA